MISRIRRIARKSYHQIFTADRPLGSFPAYEKTIVREFMGTLVWRPPFFSRSSGPRKENRYRRGYWMRSRARMCACGWSWSSLLRSRSNEASNEASVVPLNLVEGRRAAGGSGSLHLSLRKSCSHSSGLRMFWRERSSVAWALISQCVLCASAAHLFFDEPFCVAVVTPWPINHRLGFPVCESI